MDLAKRQTWGELNPVTRKPENSKAYSRRKTQDWKRELPPDPVFLIILQRAKYLHFIQNLLRKFVQVLRDTLF